MTTEQLTEARGWIADCVWDDLDESEIADLSDAQIERGIRRHYDGGIEQFIADAS